MWYVYVYLGTESWRRQAGHVTFFPLRVAYRRAHTLGGVGVCVSVHLLSLEICYAKSKMQHALCLVLVASSRISPSIPIYIIRTHVGSSLIYRSLECTGNGPFHKSVQQYAFWICILAEPGWKHAAIPVHSFRGVNMRGNYRHSSSRCVIREQLRCCHIVTE